ncbi:hypothetical protein EJP02_106 [Escherichia phage EJP2]|nr:hypothetical protein EJP02_106 [Escherichia phage EJP2]
MKLPTEWYVARSMNSTEEILGFLVDASSKTSKTFESKKEKADYWARNRTSNGKLEGIYVSNEPQEGFQIVTNVGRYRTKNVLWRVWHPEGFEFEITSDNFCDLLQTNTIIDGEIQGKLFLTSDKKLVNEKTKLFADRIAKEEKANNINASVKELKIGQGIRIETVSKSTSPDFIYMGKVHCISTHANYKYRIKDKSSLVHVLKRVIDGAYFLTAKITHDFIRVDQYDVKITPAEVCKEVNAYFKDVFDYNNAAMTHLCPVYTYVTPLCVSPKPFKKDDMHIEFTQVPGNSITRFDGSTQIRYEQDGEQYWVFGYLRPSKNTSYDSHVYNIVLTTSTGATKIFMRKCTVNEHGVLNPNAELGNMYNFTYCTEFYSPCSRHMPTSELDGKKCLVRIDIPEFLEVGHYTLK